MAKQWTALRCQQLEHNVKPETLLINGLNQISIIINATMYYVL